MRPDDLEQRRVPFEGVVNFRDLGGYETATGQRTVWGAVFRSDNLYRLSTADLTRFDALGVRSVFDLRSDDEREQHPNPVPSRQIALESRVPRREFTDGSSLRFAIDAETRLREVYLAIVATAGPLFGELFAALAEPDGLPAVIHCAGGKDRTGLAVALLLGALGVDRDTILYDYELTGKSQTAERHQEILERFVATGMSPEAAHALLGAPRWVMEAALDVIDDEYGGAEGYLRGPAGLRTTTLDALRMLLLEPATPSTD
ncbi:MAG: tyrosine-protein phosphatase [Acidimicrobiales bacterium]|jgi:protein-tyrosine phosphatase